MKKRFLLLLCALLALPVFASAEDVLMLSGAALNAAQTIAADNSLITVSYTHLTLPTNSLV